MHDGTRVDIRSKRLGILAWVPFKPPPHDDHESLEEAGALIKDSD